MTNPLINQNACKECWQPTLKKQDEFLICPMCDAKYDQNLKLIKIPSTEVYNENILNFMSSLLGHSGPPLTFKQVTKYLGLQDNSQAEQWILAFHHLLCNYHHFQNIYNKPKESWRITSSPLAISPPSKRSFPGAFDDYHFIFWRTDYSPFTNLSKEAFEIVTQLEVKQSLPWPLNRFAFAQNDFYYFTKPDSLPK